MKLLTTSPMRTLLSSTLLFLSVLSGQARCAVDMLDQPARLTSKASGVMLLGMARAGARLVAVGEHGVIVYSDNQGDSWTQARVPVSVTLTAVYFPMTNCGWAVGHDGVVLSSSDGGASWSKRFDGNLANDILLKDAQKNLEHVRLVSAGALTEADSTLAEVQAGAKFGASRPLLGVWFKNQNEGIVVGSYGLIFQTKDGGAHWESLASRMHNPEALHYNAITATPSGILTVVGEGGRVYRSADQGLTWKTFDTGYQGQLYGALSIRAEQGMERLLVFGFGGHLFQQSADGSRWIEMNRVTQKNLVSGVQLKNGDLLLTAQDGGVLRYENRVGQFHLEQPGSGMAIAGSVSSGTLLFLAGVGGIHRLHLLNQEVGQDRIASEQIRSKQPEE